MILCFYHRGTIDECSDTCDIRADVLFVQAIDLRLLTLAQRERGVIGGD
jgi:hypothetical protein